MIQYQKENLCTKFEPPGCDVIAKMMSFFENMAVTS